VLGPPLVRISTRILLPMLLILSVIPPLVTQTVSSQPSVGWNISYSTPDYLGQSMTVSIEVENQASVPMQVQSVMVSFDWYSTLQGDTPRVVQAGEKSTWEFDNIQIPSTTWTGKHSFDASVMVGWADSSGGWSNTLSSPLHATTNFGVQQAPTEQGGVTETIVGPSIPPSAPDYSGFAILAILVLVIVILGIIYVARSKRIAQSNAS
jgi:hypothetical protein